MTARARHTADDCAFEDTRDGSHAFVPLSMPTYYDDQPEQPDDSHAGPLTVLDWVLSLTEARTRVGIVVKLAALRGILGREHGSLARRATRLGVTRQGLWKAEQAVRCELAKLGIRPPNPRKKKAPVAGATRAEGSARQGNVTSLVSALSSGGTPK